MGCGGTFIANGTFDGAHWEPKRKEWKVDGDYSGRLSSFHYAAPADSKVVKDNLSPAYRYAYSEKGKFIEKFSENTYQVFHNDTVCLEQKREDLYRRILSSIERGIFKELTRDQFLAKINEWGLNEDGTKTVAPKTEFELAREALAAAKAELAALATKYRDLQTKTKKARAILS